VSNVISIRPLLDADLDAADRIMRLAFGTFIGLPDPASFLGDADMVRSRWRADPSAAFAAVLDREVVASNFATSWGSVGFFGPLTVRPDLWDRGIGRLLMEPVMDRFAAWGTRHAGLFTFAQSQKHVGLYQKFGFWPRFLTAVMSKPPGRSTGSPRWTRYSGAAEAEQPALLEHSRHLTHAVYDGLDVTREIDAVQRQSLGDTVLLWEDDQLGGAAVCHYGAGSEAGSGACYVKFGAVRPGAGASERFSRLLEACEALASSQGAARLLAGVNTARHEAYQHMLAHGFRTDFQGVAMQKGNDAGYNRPGIFLIDDWR
jgi:GNAT superfamily N-acetyltransferase